MEVNRGRNLFDTEDNVRSKYRNSQHNNRNNNQNFHSYKNRYSNNNSNRNSMYNKSRHQHSVGRPWGKGRLTHGRSGPLARRQNQRNDLRKPNDWITNNNRFMPFDKTWRDQERNKFNRQHSSNLNTRTNSYKESSEQTSNRRFFCFRVQT